LAYRLVTQKLLDVARITQEELESDDWLHLEFPQGKPGLEEFLENANPTPEETHFPRKLKFRGKRPTSLYCYRELQNLRDPLHFREASVAPLQKRSEVTAIERQMQVDARKGALKRWATGKTMRRAK